jgi:hypothetical protein
MEGEAGSDHIIILCDLTRLKTILSIPVCSIMSQPYSVVLFPNEGHVSAVPSTWLSEDKEQCTWPDAFGGRLSKLIKDQATPESDWKKHSCRVLKQYGKHRRG